MATYYWVGGNGTWDSATGTTSLSTTSGGSATFTSSTVTSSDNVIFDANSSASSYTVTVPSSSMSMFNISVAGPTTGNVTFSTSASGIGLSLSGNRLVFPATSGIMNFNMDGISISTSQTIFTANFGNTSIPFYSGGYQPSLAFSGFGLPSTNLVLASNFNGGSIRLSSGNIDTSGYNIYTYQLDASGGISSALTLRTSNVYVTSFNLAPIMNPNTSTLYLTSNTNQFGYLSSPSFSISGISAGTTLNNIVCINPTYFSSGNSSAILTCNNFTLPTPNSAGSWYTSFSQMNSVVITGTLSIPAGANASMRNGIISTGDISLSSTNSISPIILKCQTPTGLIDCDFGNVVVANTTSWSGTRIGNLQGCSNITFATGKTVYWSNTLGDNVSTGNWATTIGGTGTINNFPLAQDTAVFSTSYPTSNATTAQTVFFTVSNGIPGIGDYFFGTIDTSARNGGSNPISIDTSTYANSTVTALNAFGNINFGTGTTVGYWVNAVGNSITTQFLTLPNTSIGALSIISNTTFSGFSNTTINTLHLYPTGTLNTNNYSYDTGMGSIGVYAPAVMNMGNSVISNTCLFQSFPSGRNNTNVPTINYGANGTIKFTGIGGSAYIYGACNYVQSNSFVSGISLPNITVDIASLTLNITGNNTINNINNSATPCTVLFPAGQTTTFSTGFNLNGTSGNLVTIQSTGSGSQAILSKSSGSVNVSYVRLKDNQATGGATWTATNSVKQTNVTGWNGFYSLGQSMFFFMPN